MLKKTFNNIYFVFDLKKKKIPSLATRDGDRVKLTSQRGDRENESDGVMNEL